MIYFELRTVAVQPLLYCASRSWLQGAEELAVIIEISLNLLLVLYVLWVQLHRCVTVYFITVLKKLHSYQNPVFHIVTFLSSTVPEKYCSFHCRCCFFCSRRFCSQSQWYVDLADGFLPLAIAVCEFLLGLPFCSVVQIISSHQQAFCYLSVTVYAFTDHKPFGCLRVFAVKIVSVNDYTDFDVDMVFPPFVWVQRYMICWTTCAKVMLTCKKLSCCL